MPISKFCNRCGKRIAVGNMCKCINKIRYKPTASDKYTAEDKEFYNSPEWDVARTECISRCHGLDLYSYFILERIEFGQTVHHIVPILTDESKKLDADNLIYLTESNHRIIHNAYKHDYKGMTTLLRSLRARLDG